MKSSTWALFQTADFQSKGLLAWGRKSRVETPLFSRGWCLIANWELEWGIYLSRKCQGFVISVKTNLWSPSPSGRGHSQSVGRDVFFHAFQLLFGRQQQVVGLSWTGVSSGFLATSFISALNPGPCGCQARVLSLNHSWSPWANLSLKWKIVWELGKTKSKLTFSAKNKTKQKKWMLEKWVSLLSKF